MTGVQTCALPICFPVTISTKARKNNSAPAPATNNAKTLRNRRRRQRRRNLMSMGIINSSGSPVYNQTVENLPNQTRTGRRPNPADPRTVLGTRMGNTPMGSCAALKMLHPCGEYDLSKVKVPDGSVSTSVSLERRDEYEIGAPTTIGAATSWVCLMLHQPFVNHRDIVLRWPSTVSPTSIQLYEMIARINDENYSGNTPSAALYPSFLATSSLTGVPDEGPYTSIEYSILISSTLTPALLEDDSNYSNLFKDMRRSALGYTTDLDASDLYNQGRVVSGQWTPSVSLGTNDQQGTVGETNVVVNEYDTYEFVLPAVTTSDIVSSDMFRRQAEAKYGSYMPIRLCTPKVDFSPSSELRQISAVRPGLSGATQDNTGQRQANDIWLRGWAVGVELWLNLDPHAELRMKVVEDLELDPSPKSTFSPFMSPGYPSDDLALSVVREFSRLSPQAYDADFNRLNKMMTNLLNGLGDVLGNLGVPILSALAKPATNFLVSKFGYQAPQYRDNVPLD